MSSRRTARLLGVVAALVTAVELFTPMSGSAATVAPAASTQGFMTARVPANVDASSGGGSGFCGSISGVVNGATVQSYNLGPSFQNVYACGPTEETGWNNDPFEADWQCVELSTRFMWVAYGLRAAAGNGGVFVANNHARFPDIAVGTPSPGNLPAPGDVVSMSGGAANPNASPWGHTAVVSDVSHVDRSTGNGYINVIEENDGGVGAGRINVSNWNESDGNPQYANGLYWYTDISWLELAQNPASAPGASTAMRVCTTCATPLQHHGGPVMGASQPGDNTVASIYWAPAGAMYSPTYSSIVDGYLGNVASSTAAVDVFANNPLYGNGAPTSAPFHFAGRLSDGSPMPGSGCSTDPGYTSCVSDGQVQAELNQVITTRGQQVDLGHLYVVFLPPGVEACAGLGSCSASQFCGYHSNAALAGGTALYAVVPYPTATGVCTTGQAPNGDVIADGAVDTVSRLINEAISDPLGNAWTDASGNEIGAQCLNVYGPPIGSTDASRAQTSEFNQSIGSGHYYTQEEFSNAAFRASGSGCTQGPGSGGAGNSVAVAATSTQLANDGAATATVTVTVRSAQHVAVSGVMVHLSTYTRSGTCGAVSPTEAATDAAGHVSAVFTASTQDATCNIVANEAATGQTGHTVVVQGVAGVYHPLTPVRVADTRPASGLPLAGQTLAGRSASLPVAGTHGVPADATAVVLNVTVTNPTVSSYLTVYPTGTPLPLASNLNFVPGQTAANLVTVPLGAGGAVSFYNYSGSTDVIADLEGFMEAGSGPAGLFRSSAPFRITDTRPGSGQANSGATLHTNSTVAIRVAGVGSVPSTGAAAVVLNITAVNADTGSYLTAYPSDATRPVASNVNFLPGQVVPNRVIVPIAKDGTITLYNLAGTVDAIVDVSGWFTDASNPQATGLRFTPIAPVRVVDTRPGAGEPLAGQTLQPQGADTSPVAVTASLPTQSAAIAANVTSTGTTSSSFLSAFPAGTSIPSSSDLNWVPDQTASNMLVTGVGSGSAVTLYNLLGRADVIVDICGFWS